MIKVIESKGRKYCIACSDKEPNKTYEIRFGNPAIANVSVMAACSNCLEELCEQLEQIKEG